MKKKNVKPPRQNTTTIGRITGLKQWGHKPDKDRSFNIELSPQDAAMLGACLTKCALESYTWDRTRHALDPVQVRVEYIDVTRGDDPDRKPAMVVFRRLSSAKRAALNVVA